VGRWLPGQVTEPAANSNPRVRGADPVSPLRNLPLDQRAPRPLDPEVRELLGAVRAAGAPRIAESTPAEARAQIMRMRDGFPPGPEMTAVDDLAVLGPGGPIPVRRYRPLPEPSRGTVIYLHGGGWVLGGLEESDALCRTLAMTSGCDIVSVDYRLAPEHPFPAAVEDTDAVVRWVGTQKGLTHPLVLIGDSAGGNLAAVAARHAREAEGPPIALQVLIYPVIDHRMSSPSYREHGGAEYLVNAADMSWFWDHYVPQKARRASPDVSPGLAHDLTGLPSALVVVAEYDVLRDEGLAYAARLADAGVEVTIDHYESMIHGFFTLGGLLSTSTKAIESVAAAISAATGNQG
jgi:acetyl esterase